MPKISKVKYIAIQQDFKRVYSLSNLVNVHSPDIVDRASETQLEMGITLCSTSHCKKVVTLREAVFQYHTCLSA